MSIDAPIMFVDLNRDASVARLRNPAMGRVSRFDAVFKPVREDIAAGRSKP